MALRFLASLKYARGVAHSTYRRFHVAPASWKLVDFILSDIGEGIREVTVRDWLVKEGDRVSQFDEICVVESDKASVNITSRYDGVIKKLYYQIGDTALVGKPLIEIDTEDASASKEAVKPPDPPEVKLEPSSSPPPPPDPQVFFENVPQTHTSGVLATPAVRRIASENKITLSDVKGTGKGGRVLKEDVLNFLQIDKKKIPLSESPRLASDKIVPITSIKKAMVKSMTESGAIPTFTYSDEINMTQLVKLRSQLKPLATKRNLNLTYMPFFIKAASKCLDEFPELNSSVDEKCENMIFKADHNIGVAMDSALGLIVPNIKSVQNLKIFEIARELDRLLETGKKGMVSPKDLSGGTFSISNIGVIGGTQMRPLLLPPQVGIMAIGKIAPKPIFKEDDQIVKAQIGYVSWSADHRVIDGATMARFAVLWKSFIENPYELMFEL